MTEHPQILIVEDEPVIRMSLKRLLERHGYYVLDCGSVEDANPLLEQNPIDLIITDVRLPGESGITLIERFPHIPILVMTSYASVRSAVSAMKKGAVDYLPKPFDHQEMLASVKKILTQFKNTDPSHLDKSPCTLSNLLGTCAGMQVVHDRIQKVAPTSTTVLILGESGTGKELVAKALHENSARKNNPLVTVNCAAIPENLIETELFGHEKGAFTGAISHHKGLAEAANKGTLFLDEIGELPLEAQARLLRLLQEGEIRKVGRTQSQKIDVRVVAATHRDLKQLIALHEFREDLYFRLKVMEIRLPPLRERGDDILLLTQALLKRIAERLKKEVFQITPDALNLIKHYSWPGNIRELENTLERAMILSDSSVITPDLLGIEDKTDSHTSVDEDTSLEQYFKDFVVKNQENMTETELAEKLGISRKSLWKRRQRFLLPRFKKNNTTETEEVT